MADSTDLTLEAKVVSVLLFEDRAQVTRQGRLSLTEGAHRLVVDAVTPLVADRTVRVHLPEGVRLDEVKVQRRWRLGADEQPPDAAELTRQRQTLSDRIEDEQDAMRGLEKRRQLLERAVQLCVDDINRQMPLATELDPRWEQDLEELYSTLEALDKAWLERRAEVKEISRELAAIVVRQGTGDRLDHHLTTQLELEVFALEAGEHQILIEYLVPCALWRPLHRATLLSSEEVHFECEAALWNATGEDWSEVELRFSTARPTQSSTPPELEDDRLVLQKRRDRRVDVELRQQALPTTGEGMSEEADELPGVDDGGETRLLTAAVRATVASDGWMRRVPLFSFTAGAELERVCYPEQSPLVHLRSVQTNSSDLPLLAGPVTLLRRSGYVGRSTLDFVAAGERFALTWGGEEGLRVHRESRERRDRSKLSGRQTITRTVRLSLSNLEREPASFTLTERVPLSEIDKVKVQLDDEETSPRANADSQGMVTWPVSLPGRGTTKITLGYTITAASAVALDRL